MADENREDDEDLAAATEIDTTQAHAARIYDYLLGGDNNFAVDREATAQVAAFQGGIETARRGVRANRDFLGRAVRYLAGEVGIRQFLDLGTGIPNADNVHAVAQATTPDTRIVYVDKDSVVLAHAHKLLRGAAEGTTDFVRADIRDPEKILERAGGTLDLTERLAVMMVAILHFFSDEDDPYGVVTRLLQGVPSGTYVAISHLTGDVRPSETIAMAERYTERTDEPMVLRSKAEIARFFDGLEILEPGIVLVDRWFPHEEITPQPEGWVAPMYAAIGRKP